ncbi:MAG TPA: hypothetical protein DIU15_17980, partial [Deltaproteobacteria bacterium]|nr:hypothetical protein [Deltaproteobacteria bacterium]
MTNKKLWILLLVWCLVSVAAGCVRESGDDSAGEDGTSRPPEGQVAGDCSDAADNDGDGLFDCDDDG